MKLKSRKMNFWNAWLHPMFAYFMSRWQMLSEWIVFNDLSNPFYFIYLVSYS